MNSLDIDNEIPDPSTRIGYFMHKEIKNVWPNSGLQGNEKEGKNPNFSENYEKIVPSNIQSQSPRRKRYTIGKKKSSKSETFNKKIHSSMGLANMVKINQRARASIARIVSGFKKMKTYTNYKNLVAFHYGIIGDSAAFPVEKNHRQLLSLKLPFPKSFTLMLSKRYVLKRISVDIWNRLLAFAHKTFPLINPNNPLKLFWDLFMLLLVVTQMFMISIEKSFETDFREFPFLKFIFFGMGIDLFVCANTNYFKDGILVSDRKKILENYLKKKTLCDIIPFVYLLSIYISENMRDHELLLPILCLKWNKAKKLKGKLSGILINNSKAEALFKMIILILKICLWGHIIACFWHYIAVFSNKNRLSENNWLKSKEILREDWSVRYLYSIYWAFTTMLTVGYGDIIPTNNIEMAFNIGAMFIGCGIFGYSMNSIGEILKAASAKSNLLREQMDKVSLMMKDKKLPLETQTKVKKYLEFVWKQEQREDPEHESLIMSKLTSSLRDEIYLNTYVKHLKTVPSFNLFSERTLIGLSRYMKKVRFSPEEYIFRDGDQKDKCIYFVLDGRIQLISESDSYKGKATTKWQTFKKGEYLGVQEVFTGMPRKGSMISLDFSTLFRLDRSDIIFFLKKNPLDYEKFCSIRDQELLYKEYAQYDILCKSCGFKDHRIEECRYFKYTPNRLAVIGRHDMKGKKFAKKFRRKELGTPNALCMKDFNISALNEFHTIYNDDEELMELMNIYKIDDLQRIRLVNSYMDIADVQRENANEENHSKERLNSGGFDSHDQNNFLKKKSYILDPSNRPLKKNLRLRNMKSSEKTFISHPEEHKQPLASPSKETPTKSFTEIKTSLDFEYNVIHEKDACSPQGKSRHGFSDFIKEKSYSLEDSSKEQPKSANNLLSVNIPSSKENLDLIMNNPDNHRRGSSTGSLSSTFKIRPSSRNPKITNNTDSDSVRSYEYYFPRGNVENFIHKYNGLLVSRRFVLQSQN